MRKDYNGGMVGVALALVLAFAFFGLSGCTTAAQLQETMPVQEDDKITVGTVQKEIREGMSQPEVAEVLGSPNLVSRDKEGLETWIYDKISAVSANQSSASGASLLIIGSFSSAAVSSSSERTLTIIIKFKDGKVSSFTYRTTRF